MLALPQHDPIDAAHHLPEWEKLLPVMVALPGIFFAYLFYWWKPALPVKLARGLGWFYRLVFNKYYFDELYNLVFVRGANCLGRILWKTGDDRIIDGYGPNGVAAAVVRLGQRCGAIETGYIYHYAFAMVIGLAGFVTWFCLARG